MLTTKPYMHITKHTKLYAQNQSSKPLRSQHDTEHATTRVKSLRPAFRLSLRPLRSAQ
jgi:hypothetical protein